MNDPKLTAEESCRQVLKTIADACDQESLARAGGYLFRYVQEETVLRDCGQRGVCRTPPGCARHWEERNRELVRENEVLRSNSDHLSSENASLARQVESMAMRIESLADELAKPEDVRLREVIDALDGRAVIFDGLGERVRHLLDEMDEWIERAGEAERLADERLAHANQLQADIVNRSTIGSTIDHDKAREELELLRKAAFDLAHAHITDYPDDRDALGCPCMGPHEDGCIFRRILRTDPERARKMGLGWAL